jgi:predicted RNA-binding Zn-ribbon protein involved in translation (DUF1610 family)
MILYSVQYWDDREESIGKFHVYTDCFYDAEEEAFTYLHAMLDHDEWDILSIKAKPGVTIVNWPENDEGNFRWEADTEIECPHCAASHTVLDNILKFDCPQCSDEIIVADNLWSSIFCPTCSKQIRREELSRDVLSGKIVYKKKEES